MNEFNARRRANDYEVGYGKPPVARRFRQGQSGNPRGRPKGSRNRPINQQRLNAVVLEEAYRAVKINEGGVQITMPLVRAVMRSVGVNAVKGSPRSQQHFTTLVADAEREAPLGSNTPNITEIRRIIVEPRTQSEPSQITVRPRTDHIDDES